MVVDTPNSIHSVYIPLWHVLQEGDRDRESGSKAETPRRRGSIFSLFTKKDKSEGVKKEDKEKKLKLRLSGKKDSGSEQHQQEKFTATHTTAGNKKLEQRVTGEEYTKTKQQHDTKPRLVKRITGGDDYLRRSNTTASNLKG